MTKQHAHVWFNLAILPLLFLTGLLASGGAVTSAPVMAATAQRASREERAPAGLSATLSGRFLILWGDPQPTVGGPPETRYELAVDGEIVRLFLAEVLARPWGGVVALSGRRVTVHGEWAIGPSHGAQRAIRVDALELDTATMPPGGLDGVLAGQTGSRPWVTVMCKFADVPDEPKALPYFQGMYGSSFPGLDHYWREVSYGAIDLVGSTAVGWYTLPQPRSYYVYDADNDGDEDLDWPRAANGCTAVADPDLYFPTYAGINLMFNAELDGHAWGGGWTLPWDGQLKYYSMTLEPPWAYGNVTVLSHEMGHGLGLPHSLDGCGYVYGNQWDVMSDNWTNCGSLMDPTYGCVGQDTIAHHLDLLSWVPPERKASVGVGSHGSFVMEQLDLPESEGYLLVRIPIQGSGSHYYTVEVRRKAGYDRKLPAEGVIIHEVKDGVAHVVDVDGDCDDSNAYFVAGQSFVDAANGIIVTVSFGPQAGSTTTSDTSAQPSLSSPVSSPILTNRRIGSDDEPPYFVYLPFVSGPRYHYVVTITNSER